jgi:peptide deformylase
MNPMVTIKNMIRPIVLWGSDVLERPSEPVTNITDAEVSLIQDMVETMYKAPGIGLSGATNRRL